MQINTDQWYAKWFLWSCRVLDQWRDGSREMRALYRGTDLCRFFRTLLWGALVSAWSISVWAYMAFVVLVLPFKLFNITTVAMTIATALGVLLALFLLLTVLIGTPEAVRWAKERIAERAERAIDADRQPGFMGICWAYVVGIKRRFCPTITFKENDRG
jgi:hypothetical protein